MASAISISDQDVLLAIDLQADFMPGGALAVDGGDTMVPLVNRLARRFENVVVTQDWHRRRTLLSRPATKAPSLSIRNVSITATRPCGPSIVCRRPRAQRCIPT